MSTPVAAARASDSLAATPARRTQRRWQILREQIEHGHEPCFQSDRRHVCRRHVCVWRAECLGAEWLR